ncbi:hypothetical protein [Mucilaginibacter phyllosphaerae]|uniref:Uncharacterized protein n=1 Tax=Mucilaginibacter phyllosphaerae TaxID=1812349 RepID=A0A4Y8A8I5_9SPHI|nr:hypothetical protein [Mucilaginibacter phyllosphaerae]MBB3970892.1 hypothetical protein [Mucilaginibacter phyllosphaerae]TEW64174.1 hypothetical protein E2R65_17655 [Mucilaginibacter phyllosphaerae]GGH05245.1 hypothetical protein GCM10007352_08930 [Mucilaginibacter phyllosphaerae]
MFTKFKSPAAAALIALTVLVYSSCNKEAKVANTNTDKEMATSIAVNLYNSIGNTIASKTTSGLPATNSVRNGKKVNDLTCGQYIEVPYDNTYTKGDTVKDVMTGSNKYVVSCDAGNQPNGYTYTGSYVNTGFSPYAVYDISVKEYYTLKSLLPEFVKMEVNGNQSSVYKITTKKDGDYIVQNNTYVLKGIIIDAANRPFDITAGTANFTSAGNNAGKDFNFTGTIKFLGEHKATVSFNGQVFDITL